MRLYLDSMVWIYALEGNSKFGLAAQQLLNRIRAAGHTLLTSHFLLAELLVIPSRKGDLALSKLYTKMLTGNGVELLPFTTDVAVRFAAIRAHFRAKSPDSLHLAFAADAGANVFVTADALLCRLSVSGIGLIADLSYTLP